MVCAMNHAATLEENDKAPRIGTDGDDEVTKAASPPQATGPPSGSRRYPLRAVFLPTILALLAIWGIVAAFTLSDRAKTLDHARSQLENSVTTLVDLGTLAKTAGRAPSGPSDSERAAAFWRMTLEYSTAWIWITVDGKITAGQRPPPYADRLINVAVSSGPMTAHAALRESDALADWYHSTSQYAAALALASLGFLILADRLARALIQRASAERVAAASEERALQLGAYRTRLEATVAQRTAELQLANATLEKELSDRIAAQAALRQHDALLVAVTKGATELLGPHSLAEAVSAVLELIGQTAAVRRVQLCTMRLDEAQHLHLSLQDEWSAPDTTRSIANGGLTDIDLTAEFPAAAASLIAGKRATVSFSDLHETRNSVFHDTGVNVMLLVPILAGRLLGSLNFIDASVARRNWSWAETDTLATLAELLGNAMARAQSTKELSDANTIVQNSPTILFRLCGEPSLRLTYISQNIAKFGHDPAALVASSAWQVTLIHPDDRASVLAALSAVLAKDAPGASTEFRLLKGDGSTRWVEARYSPVRDKNGRLVEIEGIMIDITERKAAEEKIALLARTDGLTGLANRTTFAERLHQAYSASRRGGAAFGVLYLDLDHFKNVNDTLGHPMGDLLLQAVAGRLLACTRESDVVARFGGDEFAILQGDMADPASAGLLAEKLCLTLAEPFVINGNTLHLTASIGVAPLNADAADADAMLAQADLALYRAKDEGRNQYRFHSPDLDETVRKRVSLSADLHAAMERDELSLAYQPQVDLATGRIVGMEALARWHHPVRGLVMPSVFIPIAEKTGEMLPLGRWVLDQACGQMRRWIDAGIAPPVMAVNVSLIQLRNAQEFMRDVLAALEKWKLAPAILELDVTEFMLAQVSWSQNDVLMALRKVGVRIALDDFGTEYSSFDYLREYQVNNIKIDRSFISAVATDPDRAQTMRAIIGMARELKIGIIAEGIETASQRELLLSIGPKALGQGFYFSAAEEEAGATALLRKGMITPADQAHATPPPIAAQTLPRAIPPTIAP
jgi:diguanylate cyclase (GGDEF)-like protein/PAS domain S-box-containing protein